MCRDRPVCMYDKSKQYFSNISRVGAESAPTFTILGRKAPPNIINKGSREKSLARKVARQRIKRTQQKATIKNEIYAHSVKQQLSDYMGLIFEKMCRDYASVFGKSRNYHYYIFSKGD